MDLIVVQLKGGRLFKKLESKSVYLVFTVHNTFSSHYEHNNKVVVM